MLGYYLLAALVGYLLGSISFSVIFSKKLAGVDVREKGSKNAGSTNVLRVAGKQAAALTLICDILAIIIGNIIKADNNAKGLLVEIAGLAVVLGHTFPCFFNFKGGKGVATSLGVLMMINWRIGLICLVFALIIMIVFKIVSIGSIMAAILFPVLCLFIPWNFIVPGSRISFVIFSIILALMVIFNHRSNIGRLLAGEEKQLSFKK